MTLFVTLAVLGASPAALPDSKLALSRGPVQIIEQEPHCDFLDLGPIFPKRSQLYDGQVAADLLGADGFIKEERDLKDVYGRHELRWGERNPRSAMAIGVIATILIASIAQSAADDRHDDPYDARSDWAWDIETSRLNRTFIYRGYRCLRQEGTPRANRSQKIYAVLGDGEETLQEQLLALHGLVVNRQISLPVYEEVRAILLR